MDRPLDTDDVLRLLDEYFEDRKRAEADVKFTPYFDQTRDRLVEEVLNLKVDEDLLNEEHKSNYDEGYLDGKDDAELDAVKEYERGYDKGYDEGHRDGKWEANNARAA